MLTDARKRSGDSRVWLRGPAIAILVALALSPFAAQWSATRAGTERSLEARGSAQSALSARFVIESPIHPMPGRRQAASATSLPMASSDERLLDQSNALLTLSSEGFGSNVNGEREVQSEEAPVPQEEEEGRDRSPGPRLRIAVLPFKSMGPEEGEYFAEGITEELIDALSTLGGLRVIARTSVWRYKDTTKPLSQVGRELRVGSILEGSVRKSGEKVRVTAQLIDAGSEEHIWSDHFDRRAEDFIVGQSDIAERVAPILKVKLITAEKERLRRRSTESSLAYLNYLRGRAALQKDRREANIREALGLFKEAVKEDPFYAKAFTGISDSYFLLGQYLYLPHSVAFPRAREAATHALSLDDNLAEAHVSYGNLLMEEYRFSEAEDEFERGLALNPNYWLAHHWHMACLADTRRFDEALQEGKWLEEVDPLFTLNSLNLCFLYSYLGLKEAASNEVMKMRSLDPKSPWVDWGQALLAIWDSDFQRAIPHYRALTRKLPSNHERLAEMGYLYGRVGKKREARRVIQRLNALSYSTPGLAYSLAMVYCGLGDLDRFFEHLERAFREHSVWFRLLCFLRVEEVVEGDPRYLDILRRAGIFSEPEEVELHAKPEERRLAQWVTRFTHRGTPKAFDYLIRAFIEDTFIKKLSVEKSGWRTLGDVSGETGISKSLFYAPPSGRGTVLADLLGAKVAELRVFKGERGRGGEVTRVRLAYDKDPEIRRFIADQFRNKSFMVK